MCEQRFYFTQGFSHFLKYLKHSFMQTVHLNFKWHTSKWTLSSDGVQTHTRSLCLCISHLRVTRKVDWVTHWLLLGKQCPAGAGLKLCLLCTWGWSSNSSLHIGHGWMESPCRRDLCFTLSHSSDDSGNGGGGKRPSFWATGKTRHKVTSCMLEYVVTF